MISKTLIFLTLALITILFGFGAFLAEGTRLAGNFGILSFFAGFATCIYGFIN